MRVAFLRHGPTDWNDQGRIQGHTDIPLSAAGHRKMLGLLPPPPFQAARVYVSPLTRARQTAAALGLARETLDARLMEQNWGVWEGLTRGEILARHGDDAFTRAGLAGAFRPGGGESTQELEDRISAFLADVAKGEGDAIVIAHLGVLRAAYTLATGWDRATPMPAGLDVSKALILALDARGLCRIDRLNVDLVQKP